MAGQSIPGACRASIGGGRPRGSGRKPAVAQRGFGAAHAAPKPDDHWITMLSPGPPSSTSTPGPPS
ncbi:MAG TPA: hypothetical protein VNE71_01895, partial [Myxococcota bacterium]|nr:hypothetical protein [Myxococcota bacterium]